MYEWVIYGYQRLGTPEGYSERSGWPHLLPEIATAYPVWLLTYKIVHKRLGNVTERR